MNTEEKDPIIKQAFQCSDPIAQIVAAGAGCGAAGQAQAAVSWMKYGWSAGWSYCAKCSGFLR